MVAKRLKSAMLACLVGPLGAEEELPEPGGAPQRKVAPAGSPSGAPFARGLDLDSGADFASSLDGIPLNLPSALQGPGFQDDAILIKEAVGGFGYRKGPYGADQGAFAVAGSMALASAAVFSRPTLKMEYGGAASDRFGRLLWMDTRPGSTRVTYALEATRSYRPWNEWGPSSKLNGFLRLSPEDPRQGWSFTALATKERGDGGSPPVDRPLPSLYQQDYDNLRTGNGYKFQRLFLGLGRLYERGGGVTDRAQTYAGVSQMQNWSNTTLKLVDPDQGDQFELLDRRSFLGGEFKREWVVEVSNVAWTHSLGVQARADQVGAGDIYATVKRARVAPRSEARAELFHGALYGESLARWGAWQAFASARMDTQKNHVYGASPLTAQNPTATMVSPKVGLGYSPWEDSELRATWGQGFRLGNAFRDTRPMIRARSADVTFQTRVLGAWNSSVTLWRLNLEHESQFTPAENAPLLAGPSRRQGLEWDNGFAWGPWKLAGTLAWSQARYCEAPFGQDYVPGSIPQTGMASLRWAQDGLAVGCKLSSLGAYALSSDNSVVASRRNVLELSLQRDWEAWSAAVKVFNAFNIRKNANSYYYLSRLPSEELDGSYGTHTKMGDPQAIRVELTYRF